MQFTKETQGTYTYLIYKLNETDVIDELSLGMLTNNDIENIMKIIYTQIDDEIFLKYNISSKVSAKQLFSGVVNKKHLICVFKSIAGAINSLDEYMIDTNSILLDLEYIYVDMQKGTAQLVCLPIVSQKEQTDIHMFFKNIMFSTQFDQSENCDYVAKIINFLNGSSTFDIEQFDKLLIELSNTNSTPSTNKPVHSAPQKVNRYKQPSVEKPQQAIKNSMPNASVQQPQVQQTVQPKAKSAPMQQNEHNENIEKEKKSLLGKRKTKSVDIPQMKVPNAPSNPKKINSVPNMQNGNDSNEKDMSLIYLLRHYNKENADIYKKQKEAKKGVEMPNTPSQKSMKSKSMPNTNFQIPGQNSAEPINASSFSVPNSNVNMIQESEENTEAKPILQPNTQYNSVAASFGETTVLMAEPTNAGETTVLSVEQLQQSSAKAYLLRMKNNEKIMLNKPRFRIGKERSYVDYFISDNSAISRSHADVINNNGNYVIVDLDSTNHTFVNGTMLAPNVETSLKDGDQVRLGNETFEFKL